MSDSHKFTKSLTDYACGPLMLLESRILEFRSKNPNPKCVIHLTQATAMALARELAPPGAAPVLKNGRVLSVLGGRIHGMAVAVCDDPEHCDTPDAILTGPNDGDWEVI